jgi:hypothetical protein
LVARGFLLYADIPSPANFLKEFYSMRTNWLTTAGGIMAGFGVVPIAFGSAHVALPGWLYATCIFIGALGPVVIGVAAKGQDVHSTEAEVQKSTEAQTPPAPTVH